VFVSYVFEDKKHRNDVAQWGSERKLGQDIVTIAEFADQRQQGEAAIEAHLKPRIRGAAAVLALIGDNTHNHAWVRYELQVAASLNKTIILARIPDTTGAAPEGFRDRTIIALDPSAIKKALG
jgi:hypothetical protein